jgi:hypothetical protein
MSNTHAHKKTWKEYLEEAFKPIVIGSTITFMVFICSLLFNSYQFPKNIRGDKGYKGRASQPKRKFR